MRSLILSLFCLFMAVVLCAGRRYSFTSITPSNVACNPSSRRICGESRLLNATSTPNTNFGPNVCNVVRMYAVQTLSYVETRYCFGTRCRTYCTRTSNCTGPMRNLTKTSTECCEGFAVNPDDEEDAKDSLFRYRHSRKSSVLRESGCTTMLTDSVAVCLLDLSLESFVVELLSDASELIPLLGQADSEDSFTVFALNTSNPEINARGHIVNGTVDKKHLGSAKVFRSLRENTYLHLIRGEDKNYYVNGAEVLDFNACQARNGVVHVIDSPIPQSTQTIAQILSDDAQFSTFLQLLNGANVTMLLNVTQGKSRTLLAPTNDAFDKLPANAVECLLRTENRQRLNELVLIHISSPAHYNSTLSQRSRLYTFNTRYYLFVRTDDDGNVLVTNDRIPLQEVDIPANNGVIHAIPDVIVPPEVDFDKLCEEDGGLGGVLGSV